MIRNFLIILCLTVFACSGAKKASQSLKMKQMNYASYEELWKEVENLENEGKTKSANEKVEAIYKKAKGDENAPQLYKSLIHLAKYVQILEEDSELTVVNRFKEEIAQAEIPSKQILQSALAELYWQYFNSNRYKFMNRTATDGGIDESDFRTWDLNRIITETERLYAASLQPKQALAAYEIEDFTEILTDWDKKYTPLRPSLYGFLTHRAIEFYQNDQSSIIKPAYQFEIKEADAFDSWEKFLLYQPQTQDTDSYKLKTIKLYQELLGSYKISGQTAALIHTDLERLNFVYNNARVSNKETLYEDALLKLYKANEGNEQAAMVGYQMVQHYMNQGNQYQAGGEPEYENEQYQWKLKEAKEFAEQVIAKYPNSMGANNCDALIKQMGRKNVSITAEEHVVPNQPIKLLVSYTNVDEVFFKWKKVSYEDVKAMERWKYEKQRRYISNLSADGSATSQAPNVGDYQHHNYETLLTERGFAPGMYIIVASTTENFSTESILEYAVVQSTNIAYLTKPTENGQEFFVADRMNGHPIANATIELFGDRNNQNFKKSATADAEGKAKLSINERMYYNLDLKITANGETAYFNHYYRQQYEQDKRWNERAFVFTDRSIYRPGQVVYFKSINFRTNGEESNLETNKAFQVRFRDSNYEEIESLTLRSNDYGSIQGSFTIPQGRLLGNYSIEIEGYGSTNFSVEEYKRPKFQVEVEDLKGNYVVNEMITAKGKATAYAGSSISNAKVQYRVTRVVRWPYYWWGWRGPVGGSEEMEVAFGETTTDAQGNFEIPFKAIPDESVDKDGLPVFDYQIQVDVTDVNGETRSDSKTVSVGYTSLALSIDTPANTTKPEELELTIGTNNLNNQPLEAKGNVTLYKLVAPSKVLADRKWQVPDQNGIREDEFNRLFPHEAWSKEQTQPQAWKNGEKVWEKNFATKESGKEEFSVATSNLKAGYYRIVAESKDAFGNDIKQEKVVYIEGTLTDTVGDNQLIRFSMNQDSFEPGETAIATFGTAADDLWIWVEVKRDQDVIQRELLHLQNGKKQIRIPIGERDRGGLAITYGAVKYNHSITGNQLINVPWTNKELTIDVATFRDKLEPGSEETWTFTVKGHKGEQVAAELVTAMYDASLDQFRSHSWTANPIGRRQSYGSSFSSNAFNTTNFRSMGSYDYDYGNMIYPNFPMLDMFGFYIGRNYYPMRSVGYSGRNKKARVDAVEEAEMRPAAPMAVSDTLAGQVAGLQVSDGDYEFDEEELFDDESAKNKSLDVLTRTNLQETAYFFPQLTTDAEGNVSFSFTTPEALTEWKVMALAHTKDLAIGKWEGSTVTQKELMVIPNAPRFFRQGDKITFASKIANISDKDLSGVAELQLLDATTMQPVYSKFGATKQQQNFTVEKGGNTNVEWTLQVPDDVPAVTYRVVAKAGNFSDGEENGLPVLSNRKLVTESMPIALRSNQSKTFVLDKLATNNSSTLKNHKLTLEMTSNPAWYGVQALPYLMEFPYECAEQTFSRYYANSLATHVANSNPKIKSVFDTWRKYQPDALKSNLEKNQELKELLLRETPWVREAQSEAEQKRRIGLLFDMNRMASEREAELNKLQQLQMSSGGWPWFAGGRENRFITQHIVAGLGHLDALGVKDVRQGKSWNMTKDAVRFLDNELTEQFDDLKRYNKDWRKLEQVDYMVAHYFYVRSFFKDVPVNDRNQEAYDFYWNKLKKDWLSNSLYRNGLVALAFHRYGEETLAQKIVTALEENSITSEELGMYWKENTASWWWYQAPIETQALMIEVFNEVAKDQDAVDELKIWLLKNKQTNAWETTKQTSEAVYALLMTGGEWLAVDDLVEITVGGQQVDPNQLDGVQPEAGTGYFKTSWNGGEITKDMATVQATKKGEGIAWGALYWQYFEDLDKITTHETPLQLQKQLFLQTNTDKGPEISPIADGQALQLGDLVKVRITLKVDRDMEFVHMKDMRAAGFEPTNVISQYKWQDGLGYYESTKDASTDFFFDFLPKGVYVFEYPLRVNNKGDFSNGITTIQCMYAPEFTSHSEGVRVTVE